MDVLIMRILMDCSFYLSVFMPLMQKGIPGLKWGLTVLLAVWTSYVIRNWRVRDFAGGVQDVVFLEGKVLAVVQIFELVILGPSGWQEFCAPYVIGFVVTAVMLLRAGRLYMGMQGKGRFWRVNGLEFLTLLAVLSAITSDAAKKLVIGGLGVFYGKLILPILMLFLKVLEKILWFMWPFLTAIFSKVEIEGEYVQIDNSTAQDFLALDGSEMKAAPEYLKVIGVILAAAALGLFFWFMYRKLSEAGSGGDWGNRGEVRRSTMAAAERKKTSGKLFEGEKNVRYYYRRFLELCRKHGIDPDDGIVTTETMYRMAADCWKEEEVYLKDLRSVYLDVRYGGKKEEEPDRKLARTLYKKIKNAADQR